MAEKPRDYTSRGYLRDHYQTPDAFGADDYSEESGS